MSGNETEHVRDTIEIAPDGRNTIPESIRIKLELVGLKVYAEIETYGPNKFLVTILNKWKPPDPKWTGPGKGTVKKG